VEQGRSSLARSSQLETLRLGLRRRPPRPDEVLVDHRPLLAAALLGAAAVLPASAAVSAICGLALVGAVLAAVHHAEVVAHKVGEPLGTLVLALAVTVIETSLIVSMMLAGGPDKAVLARDTVYAAVMIICNGSSACASSSGPPPPRAVLPHRGRGPGVRRAGGARHAGVDSSRIHHQRAGPAYTPAQLAFAGLASLVLWGVFVFVQTVRHRDYFLPTGAAAGESEHLPPPTALAAWLSVGLLLVSLVGVVGLAKVLSPRIEAAVRGAGAPDAVIGIAIALLVLLPETVAAVRAARANRLQTSMNLALGSALASIGLTIPAVVAASQLFHLPVILGWTPGPGPPRPDLHRRRGDAGPGRTSIMQAQCTWWSSPRSSSCPSFRSGAPASSRGQSVASHPGRRAGWRTPVRHQNATRARPRLDGGCGSWRRTGGRRRRGRPAGWWRSASIRDVCS
jgi:Ca2+:H+ antiporter